MHRLLNVNSHFYQEMEALVVVLTSISSALLLCIVSGNVLVIVVICRNKKLQNANTLLLSNLALSDIVFAAQGFINIIFLLHNLATASSPAMFILRALVSIFTLVALAVERYYAILKPFVYLSRAVKSLLYKVIFAIWAIAGLLGVPGYYLEVYRGTRKNFIGNETKITPAWFETFSVTYSFMMLAFGFVLPSAVMICCYSRVIFHLWFNTKANKATNVALLKSRRKLTKLFILITVIFVITWCPSFARPVVAEFASNTKHGWKFELSATFLALVGSTANPIVFSFRSPNFRREATKLIKCSCKGRIQPKVSKNDRKNSCSLANMERQTNANRT